jgi:hypothetical protein
MAQPDSFGGVLMLLVSIDPIVRTLATKNAWMLRCAVVCACSGIFALSGTSPISKTVPFLLRLVLFPVFGELQKSASPFSIVAVDLVSAIMFYFSVMSFVIQQSIVDSTVSGAIDHFVITLCWAFVALRSRQIVPFEAHQAELGRTAVAVASAVVAIARLLPSDNSFAFTAASVVASYCAVQLLAAAQADENGGAFRVRLVFLGGVLPSVQWRAAEEAAQR